MQSQQISVLTFDTFVIAPACTVSKDLPPGQSDSFWSPITATLITGEHKAILVDPLLTVAQGRALADWISNSGKDLTTVYVTHGPATTGLAWGDPCTFSAGPTCRNAERRRFHASTTFTGGVRGWESLFPDQIAPGAAVAEPLTGFCLKLEGDELVAIEVGHTDRDDTTILHVPSIGPQVAGDVIYSDVRVYLAESNQEKRLEWIHALDSVEALQPRAVVAGHKRGTRPADPHRCGGNATIQP